MAKISLIILVCLLVGLSDCQAESNESETLTEKKEEGLAEKNDNQNFKQGQETLAILTSDTTTTQESSEPPIDMLWKELGALRERLEETNRKLDASDKQLAELTSLRTMDRGQAQVAFSAALPVADGTLGPVNTDYPLVYQHVFSNIGNTYSPITGYFTAPVQGVYYFSFTSLWWGGDGSTGGSLYKNGYKAVSWYANSQPHTATGSNSAILQLQAGDKVNVRLWEGRSISDNGNKYTTFNGFLLFPM